MSIYGIRGPSPSPSPLRPDGPSSARPGSDATSAGQARRTGALPPAVQPNAPKQVLAPSSLPVPVQPPQGTDPELWSVLTQDERAYFAKLGAMGPLTYGRVLSGHVPSPAPMARGGRLDVKA